MRGVIYKYTAPNGKVYIGQTMNENHRKECWRSKKTHYGGRRMMKARKEFPLDSFKYDVLYTYEADDKKSVREMLHLLEGIYIAIYRADTESCGLNMGAGGRRNFGVPKTEEERQKISKTLTGRKGIPRTKEQKAKTSNTLSWRGVAQYTIDGKLVKTYINSIEASKQTGVQQTNISKVCRHERKWAGGYVWRYLHNKKEVS